MRTIEADNAESYLREAGRIEPAEAVRIEELTGGVSNRVLRVSFPAGERDDFVLKQARAQLRTPQPWHSRIERIFREVEVLQWCAKLAPTQQVPGVLFVDRDNYLFAMTAAPRHHQTWKARLLAGETDCNVATQCGRLLGAIHAGSWKNNEVARALSDRGVFDELRLDPYYRTLATTRPAIATRIERLITSVDEHCLALVHADFSPKNLLIFDGRLLLVDFETGHYGDPAFDLGFFLSHLVLKAFHHSSDHDRYLELTVEFWDAYHGALQSVVSRPKLAALESRGVMHFAACAWARLDGKSGIDYLDDRARRDQVRSLCREVLDADQLEWTAVLDRSRQLLTES